MLVGAGGAGRALAFGAKIRGARILIFDIDFGKITRTSIYTCFENLTQLIFDQFVGVKFLYFSGLSVHLLTN